MVRDLVVGVVVDVLGKVRIKNLQLGGVDGVPAAARDLAILDPAKFVVLDPEVGLQDLSRGGEPEQRRVPFCQAAALAIHVLCDSGRLVAKETEPRARGARGQALLEK